MRIAFAENTRSYITDHIKFADAKAGAILALGLTVLSLVASIAARALDSFADLASWVWAVAVLAAVPFITGAVMMVVNTIKALAPNTSTANQSLTSFPDIAKMSDESYVAACSQLTEDAAVEAYARSNAALARIATAKFNAISGAVWWLRVLLFSGYIIALVCLVAIGVGG